MLTYIYLFTKVWHHHPTYFAHIFVVKPEPCCWWQNVFLDRPETSVVFWLVPKVLLALHVYWPNASLVVMGRLRVCLLPICEIWCCLVSRGSPFLYQVTLAFGDEWTTQITSVWSPSLVWTKVSSWSISGRSGDKKRYSIESFVMET